MTAILGVSGLYHDSAAVLLIDGRVAAAAQEERFTRIRHDQRFPRHAIEWCLKEAALDPADLEFAGFYEKPLVKFRRLVQTHAALAPRGYGRYVHSIPQWLTQKLHLPADFDRALRGRYRGRYVFADHHEAHAASAFFPSPFEQAAILVVDGMGEWSTTTLGTGSGNRVRMSREIRFPHSLGLLYSAFAYYLGFRVNSGEHQVTRLATNGEPRFKDLILRHLIHVRDDGSFWMDQKYFDYCGGRTMTSAAFDDLFGGPPRPADSVATQREIDLAASIHDVCEEVMLRCARHLQKTTRMQNLVVAGDVIDWVGVGRVRRDGVFSDVWMPPAAGDAGGALGVARLIWHHVLAQPRTPRASDPDDAAHHQSAGSN